MESKLKFIRVFLVLMVAWSVNVAAEQMTTKQVRFANAWVKAPMPGMRMTAGYVDIKNLTNNDLRLIGVRTSISAMSELHGMVMVNNVMQMRFASDGWVITPGTTLSLAPGGKHAMLMSINSNLQDLPEVQLEFNIEGLGWILVPAVVKKPML
jgi:copper(I)-binding protein